MRRVLFILLAVAFGCTFGFLLNSPTFAADKTIELKYSSFFPAQPFRFDSESTFRDPKTNIFIKSQQSKR